VIRRSILGMPIWRLVLPVAGFAVLVAVHLVLFAVFPFLSIVP
jgi:hypothetical protein